MTDYTGAIYTKNETELSWSIRSDVVFIKTKQDNDMIDCIGMVYFKTKIKL